MFKKSLIIYSISLALLFSSGTAFSNGVLDRYKQESQQKELDHLSGDELYRHIKDNRLENTGFFKERIASQPMSNISYLTSDARSSLLALDFERARNKANQAIEQGIAYLDDLAKKRATLAELKNKKLKKKITKEELNTLLRMPKEFSEIRRIDKEKKAVLEALERPFGVLLSISLTKGNADEMRATIPMMEKVNESYHSYGVDKDGNSLGPGDNANRKIISRYESLVGGLVDLYSLRNSLTTLSPDEQKLVKSNIFNGALKGGGIRLGYINNELEFIVDTFESLYELSVFNNELAQKFRISGYLKSAVIPYAKENKKYFTEYKPFLMQWLKYYERQTGRTILQGDRIVFGIQ